MPKEGTVKIEVRVSTSKIGSESKRIVEVDDESTPEDIEQIAIEAMWELINFEWKQL